MLYAIRQIFLKGGTIKDAIAYVVKQTGNMPTKLEGLQMIKMYQNIQSLLLSSPGDCLSDGEFGVGIRNFLFSLETDQTVKSIIVDNIRQQVKCLLKEKILSKKG